MGENVKHLGSTTISSKHQITIPVAALRQAGLEVSDRLRVTVAKPGRLMLERIDDAVNELAGALTGRIDREILAELDSEWD